MNALAHLHTHTIKHPAHTIEHPACARPDLLSGRCCHICQHNWLMHTRFVPISTNQTRYHQKTPLRKLVSHACAGSATTGRSTTRSGLHTHTHTIKHGHTHDQHPHLLQLWWFCLIWSTRCRWCKPPTRPWWAMPLLFGENVHVPYSPKNIHIPAIQTPVKLHAGLVCR